MSGKLLSLLTAAALLLPAGALEWLTDVEQAQKKAAAEGKMVLVEFTGTDWCVYCRKLKAEVLDKPEFAGYADAKFVCVEMDLPHKKLLPEKQLEYNKAVAKKYGVKGYPTLLVLNGAGEVTGGFIGYLPTVREVTDLLDIAAQNAKDLPRLNELKGDERTQALKHLYRTFRSLEKLESAQTYRKMLLECDTDNVTGIQDEERGFRELEGYRTRMREAADDDAVLRIVEEGLAVTKVPEVRVELLNRKVQIMQKRVQTVADLMEMKEVMLESARQIPEQADAMVSSVEAAFRDPEQLLELILSQRQPTPATRPQH